MSKSVADIYSGMFKKHATEHVVKQQQEQQTSNDVIHESSIIGAFAKKSKVVNESKVNSAALVNNLSLIKESIETNPALAIKELEKIIKSLQ